jgi:hypothetical protein
MYSRLGYAFSKTLQSLHTVLRTRGEFAILFAFVLTIIGFSGMQIAIDHDVDNIPDQIIIGFAAATVFFLATIGFVTFISVLFVFVYGLTIGQDAGTDLQGLMGWSSIWRIVLSFVVSGAVTAALFNLFSEGLREMPVLRTQYQTIIDATN